MSQDNELKFQRGAAANTEFEDRNKDTKNCHHDRDGVAGLGRISSLSQPCGDLSKDGGTLLCFHECRDAFDNLPQINFCEISESDDRDAASMGARHNRGELLAHRAGVKDAVLGVTGTSCARLAKPYPFATMTSPFLTTATAIPGIFCRDISVETNRSISSSMVSRGVADTPLHSTLRRRKVGATNRFTNNDCKSRPLLCSRTVREF